MARIIVQSPLSFRANVGLLVLLGARRWAERTWFEKGTKSPQPWELGHSGVYAAKDELMASPVEGSGPIRSVRPLRRVHVVWAASRSGSLV